MIHRHRRWLIGIVSAACAAVILAPSGHAQAGRAFTTNFTLGEFADRRARIYDAIGPQAVALMQGLPSVHSSAIFRQSNEFFYVSGVVAPQALLLMDGATRRSTLYLPKQNASRAATEGDLRQTPPTIRGMAASAAKTTSANSSSPGRRGLRSKTCRPS